jgi:glycosyltransferase 2 family protein
VSDAPEPPVLELLEEPLVAPPEKLRAFFTKPRMFLGFALSVMVAVLITRLFSLHLSHNFGVVRTQAHEPEFLAYAVLCVIAYLLADAAALVLLARVHRKSVPLRPLLLLSLRANFVGGTTSFGGVEIPYQAFSLRKQGLSLTEATSVILVKGVVHTSVLVLVALTALIPATGSPITPLQRWFVIAAVVLMAIAWIAGSLWVRRPIGLEQLPERFHKNIHAAREAFGEYHHAGWRVWFGVIVATVAYWVAMFAIIPLILIGLGWHGRPFSIITGQAVLQVIMPLSPLAGGAGVAELGYLALIGPAAAETIRVPSLILWRLCTWLIPVAIGGLAFLVKGGAQAAVPSASAPATRSAAAPAVPSVAASANPPASPRATQPPLEEVGNSD